MSEVDWFQFDDWKKTTFKNAGGSKKGSIVRANVKLILNPKDWSGKVEAFEKFLKDTSGKNMLEQERAKYCIHFDGHEFDRSSNAKLDFRNYHFPCSVSFDRVDFGDGSVHFYGSTFADGNVSFVSTIFRVGVVMFDSIQFGNGDFSMFHTRFYGGSLLFRNAKFGNANVSLHKLQLSENLSLKAPYMDIEGRLYVSGNFAKEAIFKELKVKKSSSFSGSTFKKCPDFRDAEFGRPPEVSGMIVTAPKLKEGRRYYIYDCCSKRTQGAEASKYRKLNAMAKAANDHDKELEFFAYEMMAKRGVEISGFWELFANSFYYHVSYYGQSWIRPLIGMAISCFTFFWIYFIYAMGSLKCLENVWFSIRYSMLNTLPFVSALYRSSIQPKDYESGLMLDLDKMATVNDEMVNGSLGGLMFFSFIQQIIGIVLLFFLLLGLRNRFRLK